MLDPEKLLSTVGSGSGQKIVRIRNNTGLFQFLKLKIDTGSYRYSLVKINFKLHNVFLNLILLLIHRYIKKLFNWKQYRIIFCSFLFNCPASSRPNVLIISLSVWKAWKYILI
jgi:hypothetical protein